VNSKLHDEPTAKIVPLLKSLNLIALQFRRCKICRQFSLA